MEFDSDRAIRTAERAGAQYCDVRTESTVGLSLEMTDRSLEKAIHGSKAGTAIRVLIDGAWGFFTTNASMDEVDCVNRAMAMARVVGRGDAVLADSDPHTGEMIMPVAKNPLDIPLEEKAGFIRAMADEVLDVKKAVSVTTTFEDGVRDVRIVSSEGTDVRSMVARTMAQANVTAKDGANIVGFRLRVGGTLGFELMDDSVIERTRKTAEKAVQLLDAKHPPSGQLPMITDPDLTGVFIHEALGHAVEADLVANGSSILNGRLGEDIGVEGVNVYDDPSIPGAFGSFPFDDEGVHSRRRDLVVNGKLVNFINSRETASQLDLEVNGGARAMDYSVRPLVRMSNTMMGPGDMTLEELIEDVKEGILASGTRGGMVDTEKGTFQFNAQEAHLIENGEIRTPLRDVSFSGSVLSTLMDIEGMTRSSELGSPGFCGKGGDLQIIPVGDGGPYVRFSKIVVGGR